MSLLTVVPHITDAIQEWVVRVAEMEVESGIKADVCMVEVRVV